jgi:hypothetical protein
MTGSHRRSPRALIVGIALLVVVALTACSPAGSEPETSGTSTPTDVRARLVAGLQGTSPTKARLVEQGETSLTPVAAAWLPGWQILDVQNNTAPHPQRFFVALPDSGRAEVLSEQPNTFSTVLVDAGVRIDSADLAAEVGGVFLDVTRDFRSYAYRINRIDDIAWVPRPSAAEQAARNKLIETYGSEIEPPHAVESDEGWLVTVWMVQGRDLVIHDLGIASATPITDQVQTVEEDIPVPFSA